MTEYRWATGRSRKLDAQEAGEELERIRLAHGGELRTPDIVDESRPKGAKLHPAFTWDDAKAAELYRRKEAREIVQAVVVKSEQAGKSEPVEVRAYHSVSLNSDAPEERCYVPLKQVLEDQHLEARVIGQLKSRMRYYLNEVKKFERLRPLEGPFQAALMAVEELSEEEVEVTQ